MSARVTEMALLRYLKPNNGLPEPRGFLSTAMSREAIAPANEEVEKELIALAAARGIVQKCNPSLLVQNGGPVELNKFWAHPLLKRMKFVQRKATTSKSKSSFTDFAVKKAEFLDAVAEAVVMEEIAAELVLNWDQTGMKLVPSSVWTMERQGERRVEMVGVNDKRQITAIFCGTMLYYI